MAASLRSIIATLLCALYLAQLVSGKRKCKLICRFKKCRPFTGLPPSSTSRLTLRAPGVAALGPVVCLNDFLDSVGFVLKTGEPILEQGGALPDIPMSSWEPEGLSPLFAKKYFRTKKIPLLHKSGFTRLPAQGNQYEYLNSLCVRLPIYSYQVMRKGKVTVVKTDRKPEDCVAFGTRATIILVELSWEGNDDLDLKVTEPGGLILWRFGSQNTPSGGSFVSDKGGDRCGSKVKSGKEVVNYKDNNNVRKKIMSGTYKVEVEHSDNCGRGATKWNLRVSINGEEVLFKKGKDNGNLSSLIISTSFAFSK